MSAITAKASRKMKKYAVLTREPRCFLGSFDFSWEQRKFDEVFDCTVPNNTLSRAELSYDEGTVLNVHYGDVLIKYGSVLDVQKDDIPRIPHRCREDFNGALRIYGLSIVPFLPMPIASRSYDNASFTLSIYPPVP